MTSYAPKSEHEFLIDSCDWKESLSKPELKAMSKHAMKVHGIVEELNVYTGDARVFYSGPDGIDKWINKHAKKKSFGTCAQELFMDLSAAGDDEEPTEVSKWYFDGKEVYVALERNWNKNKKKFKIELPAMTYLEWTKYAEELNDKAFG